MNNLILDIGCGEYPEGDINLDRKSLKNINNFIKADAIYLPIRNKCIPIVYSSHLMEHILRVDLLLKEFYRVSKDKVIIRVPNNPINKESPNHIYSWSKSSLNNLLKLYFDNVKVYLYVGNIRIYEGRLMNLFFRLKLIKLLLWFMRIELIAICKTNENLSRIPPFVEKSLG